MKDKNFNISDPKIRVLVAPLDWGLGHTTRCIPIISELLKQDCEVLIGAEGHSKALLEQEFPQLTFLALKGYDMLYSRSRFWLPLKLLLQFPKLISRIYYEKRWLKKTIQTNGINLVISDNRMGLHDPLVPCIYITHQLKIKTGNRLTERIAQSIHYHFINKFSACWVPDIAGENNLAGDLSHPVVLPKIPLLYIGPLSRFKKISVEKKYDIAVILSGPEPQRTVFENIIIKELQKYKGFCLLVRGLPAGVQICKCENEQVEIHNHLSSTALNNAIQQSACVIGRSGYSTVMDLVKLQQKAILVPTPGQTEQVYLAAYLMQKKIFYCINQHEFSLQESLVKLADFSSTQLTISQDEYKVIIENFISSLSLVSAE